MGWDVAREERVLLCGHLFWMPQPSITYLGGVGQHLGCSKRAAQDTVAENRVWTPTAGPRATACRLERVETLSVQQLVARPSFEAH